MVDQLKAMALGDVTLLSTHYVKAWEKHMSDFGEVKFADEWQLDREQLKFSRLEVEKQGPAVSGVHHFISEHGRDINVLLSLYLPIPSKVYKMMPNLKVIGICREDIDNINVKEATENGVLVFNLIGRNAHAISDFTIGLMLSECRNIARAHYAIKHGTWRKSFANSDYTPELAGKRVGLIGFGYRGSLVAKKLSGFDCDVVVYDPFVDDSKLQEYGARPMGLEQLLTTSDFISLHAPLTDANRYMIGPNFIQMMKATAYVINTSSPALIDQDALVEALKDGRLMGAALDVFEVEPLPADSPLMRLDNVTLTTHIASASTDALVHAPELLLEDMAKLFRGEDANFIVNPEVLKQREFRAWLEQE